MEARPTWAWHSLTRPWWVVALTVLLVNDHLLKEVATGPVTGKLSDVVGLVVAPPLVAVALGAVTRRRVDGRLAVALVALGFTLTQLVPAVSAAVAGVSQVLFGAGSVTPDVTDLWALPVLAVPWRASRASEVRADDRRGRGSGASRPDRVLLAVGAVACLATSAAGPIGVSTVALDGDEVVVGVGSAYRGDPVDRWLASADGGASWRAIDGCEADGCSVGGYEACGPLGCIRVERDRVLLLEGGEPSTVHIQPGRLEALEARDASHEVSLGPAVVGRSRAYVAAGTAGLLVSEDLQQWRYIAAGEIEPATTRWWALLGVDVAGVLVAVALAAGYLATRRRWRGSPGPRVLGTVGLLAAALAAATVGAGWSVLSASTAAAAVMILPIGLAVLAGGLLGTPEGGWRPVAVALGLGALVGVAIVLLAGSGALPFDLRLAAPPAALAVSVLRGRATS